MTEIDDLDFDALWDYNHPDQTEAKFLAALAKFSEGNLGRLELLTQIARAQGLQEKFDEAHRTLDNVETLLSKEDSRTGVRYLLERG